MNHAVFTPIAPRQPPANQVGLLPWLRSRFFDGWANSLLTVLVLAIKTWGIMVLTLTALAADCGASVRTLNRLFLQQLGCSFRQWREQVGQPPGPGRRIVHRDSRNHRSQQEGRKGWLIGKEKPLDGLDGLRRRQGVAWKWAEAGGKWGRQLLHRRREQDWKGQEGEECPAQGGRSQGRQ